MSANADANLDTLVIRLAEGDRSAFTGVFQALWTPLLRLCRGMLNNEADARDAAQQSLEKILLRASDYDGRRRALPWALAIAAWECRTIRRQRQRRRETTADEQHEQHELMVEHTEDEFARRELGHMALQAVSELSDSDREALIGTFWEEATSVEGATLRKRRQRALVRLRAILRNLYGL
jgi:RNA polymerase sigma-70 factor (ECF subfamily)